MVPPPSALLIRGASLDESSFPEQHPIFRQYPLNPRSQILRTTKSMCIDIKGGREGWIEIHPCQPSEPVQEIFSVTRGMLPTSTFTLWNTEGFTLKNGSTKLVSSFFKAIHSKEHTN
jgi:hypothetical protein